MNKKKYRFPDGEASWASIEFSGQPSQWLYYSFILFMAAVVVIAIIFSSVAMVGVSVEGYGRLIGLNPAVPLRAATKMTIAKVLVSENEIVKKGQVLITSVEGVDKVQSAYIESYLSGLTSVLDQLGKPCRNCVEKLKALQSEYSKIQAHGEILGMLSGVQDSSREVRLALEESGQIPFLLNDINLHLKSARKRLASLNKSTSASQGQKESLFNEIVSLETRIRERNRATAERVDSAQSRLRVRISDVHNQMSFLKSQNILLAPFAGSVTALKTRGSGEMVQLGQELMILNPLDSPLIAEVEIRNQDVAKVQVGYEAEVKVDSMPEYEYGTLRGKILEIVRKDRPAFDSSDMSPSKFVARISLSSQSLSRRGVETPLQSGMTVRAVIISRRVEVIHILISSLFALSDEM